MTFFSNLEVHSSAEIFLKRIMTSLKVKQFKTTFTDHTVEPHTTARSYNTHRDWLVSWFGRIVLPPSGHFVLWTLDCQPCEQVSFIEKVERRDLNPRPLTSDVTSESVNHHCNVRTPYSHINQSAHIWTSAATQSPVHFRNSWKCGLLLVLTNEL